MSGEPTVRYEYRVVDKDGRPYPSHPPFSTWTRRGARPLPWMRVALRSGDRIGFRRSPRREWEPVS